MQVHICISTSCCRKTKQKQNQQLDHCICAQSRACITLQTGLGIVGKVIKTHSSYDLRWFKTHSTLLQFSTFLEQLLWSQINQHGQEHDKSSQQAGQGTQADCTLMSMSVTLRSRLEIFLQTHKVAVLNTLRRPCCDAAESVAVRFREE